MGSGRTHERSRRKLIIMAKKNRTLEHPSCHDSKPEEIKEEEKIRYQDFLVEERDIYTNDRDERFVYVPALIRIAKEHAAMKGWLTDVVQAPTKENLWSATVVVKCQFRNGDFASGAADCRVTTAGDGFQNYTTALAETRAIGRALRRYLDINLCTFEEQYTPENNSITDTQKNCIEKKFLKKGLFNIKDVCKIVGRDVASLTDLTEKEASDLLMKLNKLLKRKQLAKKANE